MTIGAQIIILSMVLGAISGFLRTVWVRPDDDRQYVGHMVGGAFVGLIAGSLIAGILSPQSD